MDPKLNELAQQIHDADPDDPNVGQWARQLALLLIARKPTMAELATGIPQALAEVRAQRDAAVTLLRKFMSATGGALADVRAQAADLLGG